VRSTEIFGPVLGSRKSSRLISPEVIFDPLLYFSAKQRSSAPLEIDHLPNLIEPNNVAVWRIPDEENILIELFLNIQGAYIYSNCASGPQHRLVVTCRNAQDDSRTTIADAQLSS